jgi:nucleotide-binding universal stress UspA family protein
VAEAMGYLGGAIIVVALGLVVSWYWDALPDAARLSLVGGAALIMGAAGLLVPRGMGVAGLRLRAVLWLAATAGTVGFLALMGDEVLHWEGEVVTTFATGTATLIAAALWAAHRHPVQHAAVLPLLVAAAAAGTGLLPHVGALPGAAIWAVGVAWALLAWGGVLQPRRFGLILGTVAAVVGAAVVAGFIAADHAAIEAELHGWKLRIIHVRQTAAPRSEPDPDATLLEQLTERVHARSRTVPVTSSLLVGVPMTTLLAEAKDADLVVVGSRHGATDAMLGRTVGAPVAAHHTGPVMVVRVPGWPPGPEFPRRPIVVGDDASRVAAQAIAFARAEARARGCDLLVFTVSDGNADRPNDTVDSVDGVTVHHRRIASTAEAALEAASWQAAAIVVGRRSHGIAGTPLGGVPRSLIQHAHCPLFLVG